MSKNQKGLGYKLYIIFLISPVRFLVVEKNKKTTNNLHINSSSQRMLTRSIGIVRTGREERQTYLDVHSRNDL